MQSQDLAIELVPTKEEINQTQKSYVIFFLW